MFGLVRSPVLELRHVFNSITTRLAAGAMVVYNTISSRSYTPEQQRQTTETGSRSDKVRQILNLVLSITQVLVIPFATLTGIGQPIGTDAGNDAPIIPAAYAFSIWSIIFAGSIAYGIYQALPAQRENPLLRRIGFATAWAFGATTLWSLVAQLQGSSWPTVVLMANILLALIYAFIQLIPLQESLSRKEWWTVLMPLSVFLGWITVAMVANTSATLYQAGVRDFVLSEASWALVMSIVAGCIATFVTYVSRGNAPYALTLIWAFAGIVVRSNDQYPALAIVAAVMGGVVATELVVARRRRTAF